MNQIKKLLGYTRGLRLYFIVIAAMSALGAAANFATPYIMKLATDWVVDIAAGKIDFEPFVLAWFVAGIVCVVIVNTIAADVGGWFGDMMAVRARRQLSRVYFEHLLRLPQHYYDGEVTGKIINRLSRAITETTHFLQFFSNNLLQMLLTLFATIIIMAVYSPWLAVLFLLLFPVNIFLTTKTSGRWQKYEEKKNHHFDIASGRFAESVGQMRLVKSFGSQSRELHEFDGRLIKMIHLTAKQSRWWHSMNALRGISFGTIFAAIYGVIFYYAAMGRFGAGDIVLLITLITRASFPLTNMSFFIDSYQRAVSNSKDFIRAMDETPESDDISKRLTVTSGEIVFDGVDFSYEDKNRVLQNISFRLKPGSKLALVGESGGGKSTIANILMRLYEPDSGSVKIDGQDITEFSRDSVRGQVATVFQDAALFSGTIRENIAYANPNANDAEVRAAAKAANAFSFIDKFEDGFETEIGERGIKLSGGQKQRIAIARAILKDAPILILDEATSALDSKAEHEVQQALERLMKGRTTLIIAHRLSTIAHVDTIVTLQNGTINEVGSPKKLASTDGIYAQLLKLQTASADIAKKQLAEYDIAT